jgi:hypothetical protein
VKNSARILYSILFLLTSGFIVFIINATPSFAISVVQSSPQPYGATIQVGGCTARENTFDNIYLYAPSSGGEINYDTEYCGNVIGSDPIIFDYYKYTNAGNSIYGPGTYTFVELTDNTCADNSTLTAARSCPEYAGEASITFTAPTCSVTVSPARVDVSSTNDINFHIVNGSEVTPIEWIKITRPSGNFKIEGVGPEGNDFTSITEITPSSSYDQLLSVTSGADEAGSTDWIIETADNSSGSNPTSCIGTLGTAITIHVNPLTISNVAVTNASATSETITWDTSVAADSYVFYGLTSDYGSTESDASLSTSHSVTLSGLSEDTTYRFYVQSTDASANTVRSTEAAFTTSSGVAATTTVTTTTVTTTVIRTITPSPTPTPVPDRISPAVTVATDFVKPFLKSPEISGKATDNKDVASISYSLDDGKNWLPVDVITSPGAKATNYSFTPAIFEDGNYKLRVRAKDSAGNTGVSKTYTLIIDRLPPQIGAVMYSTGPQLLIPDKNGVIFTLPNMNNKITLSAVGGPTNIEISSGNKLYSLVKNNDNGLWSGILNFTKQGTYKLSAKAIDGAQNITERKLNTVVVLDSGKIMNGNLPVTSGKVTLWYFDNQTQNFVVWDGKSYGQSNPQNLTKNGEYGFFAPMGKYYLEVNSSGFKTMRSEIFSLSENMPIATVINLEKSFGINLGMFTFYLPDFSVSKQTVVIKPPVASVQAQAMDSIIGSEFPNADIFAEGRNISTISFLGKPTIYIFLSTWSPYVSQQLKFAQNLAVNPQINIVPIVSQETSTSVSVFGKRGGYSFPVYADPDGLLVKPMELSFLPTNIFVDRKGIVQKIKVGILTENELLENVVN